MSTGSFSAIGRRQQGGAAIEFALAFPLFFTLFYAIVSYGLFMVLEQSLSEAVKEGARAAIKVDPAIAGYQTTAAATARTAVANVLDWLPTAQKNAILGTAPGYSNVSVTFPYDAATGSRIKVSLTYTYAAAPLLPILTFPIIGNVPSIPSSVVIYADGLL